MKLDIQDLFVASFDTGSVPAGDPTLPTVDTGPPTTVTACDGECPPLTKDCF